MMRMRKGATVTTPTYDTPGEAYLDALQHGCADAEAVLSVLPGDPEELTPPSPLSGEWAGGSIPEIFGEWPADEYLDQYEEGYLEGWQVTIDSYIEEREGR